MTLNLFVFGAFLFDSGFQLGNLGQQFVVDCLSCFRALYTILSAGKKFGFGFYIIQGILVKIVA